MSQNSNVYLEPGTPAFLHFAQCPPLAQSTPAAFTGVDPVIGGLNVNVPCGRCCYLSIGNKVCTDSTL